jgi:hypothetical protein
LVGLFPHNSDIPFYPYLYTNIYNWSKWEGRMRDPTRFLPHGPAAMPKVSVISRILG